MECITAESCNPHFGGFFDTVRSVTTIVQRI
jgi:hypothetical protein